MKFANTEDRNTAIKVLKEVINKQNGSTVWTKPDLPLTARVNQAFLFKIKHVMVEWGYDRKSIWVDVDEGSLKVGFDTVLTSRVDGANLNIEFISAEWCAEVMSEEYEKARMECEAKLKKGQQPAKGNFVKS